MLFVISAFFSIPVLENLMDFCHQTSNHVIFTDEQMPGHSRTLNRS